MRKRAKVQACRRARCKDAKVINVSKQKFMVKGMHCPSCEKLLQMDIGELKGVKSVKADHKKGEVEVEGDGFDAAAVKKAIEQNGYKIN